mmetsp:Transcript_21520/g.61003  ORF Transcript_21520/g.61003 Transcript_21520/m.61003 type:complete len:207 (+) Transcript_21520:86-706(+)
MRRARKGPSMTWHNKSKSTRPANFNAWVRESTGIAISQPCARESTKARQRSMTLAGTAPLPAAWRAQSTSAWSNICATSSKRRVFCCTGTSGRRAPCERSSSIRSFACARMASSFKLERNSRFFTLKATCRSLTRFAADFSWSRGVEISSFFARGVLGLSSSSTSSSASPSPSASFAGASGAAMGTSSSKFFFAAAFLRSFRCSTS